MNRSIVGKFLKSLREEKGLTQVQLSLKLNGGYSDAAISKWEGGKSLPNIDDLKRLANYFGVTVDEILNGTRNEETDFAEKYFICDDKWMSRYNPDELYHIREEQELLIETRFKKLLRKMVGDGLSVNEDKEFDFIVNNFYQVFLPAIESKNEDAYRRCPEVNIWIEDIDYVAIYHEVLPEGLYGIKFEIYKRSMLMHNCSTDEKVWEAGKKFIFSKRQNIWRDINNAIDDEENAVRNRIQKLDDVEKDILLAAIQTINVKSTYDEKTYIKLYHREYDEEQLTKRAIKLLIECGAKLNHVLLGYWRTINSSYSTLDELVDLHKKYKKTLLISVFENDRYRFFTVENNKNNRDVLGIEYINDIFNEADFTALEERLYSGNNTILMPFKDWSCGNSEESAFIYARKQILDMSLSEYMDKRDETKTQELLNNLDTLSLSEIREKYFPQEYRGEYIDDSKTMTKEELNSKYYLRK